MTISARVAAVAIIATMTAWPRAQTLQPTPAQDSRSGLITGRVVEAESGAPVASALVTLSRSQSPTPGVAAATSSGPAAPIPPTLSDADGRYFFSDLPAGSYRIEATKNGYLPGMYGRRRPGGAELSIVIDEGGHRGDVNITIWRYATISGRVVDDLGEPMVGREVRGVAQSYVAGNRVTTFAGRTFTDDRGIYRLSNLTPGDYLIVAPATVTSEPATFAGTIRAAGDTPRAYLQTMTDIGTAQMSVDRADVMTSAGRSVLSPMGDLPGSPPVDGAWMTYPTTFYPSATTTGAATPVRAVSGSDRSATDLVVRLAATYQVSGVVADVDGPAANHAVHLLPADSADLPLFDVSTAVTNASGEFTFYAVPPGQYIARVVRSPWPDAPGQRLAILGGTGAVKSIGTIMSGPGGSAPSATEPLMFANAPVAVADRAVRDLRLTMQPGPRVRGRAVFEGSRPAPTPAEIARMVVIIETANGRVDRNILPGMFADDGRFTSASVLPGRYLVRSPGPAGWTLKSATYQGRDVSETPLDLSGDVDDVVITFTDRASRLTGSVQDSGKDLGAGAFVALFPTDARAWTDYGRTSRRVQSATASATGTFSLALPPVGQYYLVAISDEQSIDWRNPATLAKLAAVADRLDVRDDQASAHTLAMRRIQ